MFIILFSTGFTTCPPTFANCFSNTIFTHKGDSDLFLLRVNMKLTASFFILCILFWLVICSVEGQTKNQIFCGNDTAYKIDCDLKSNCGNLLRKFEAQGKASSWNRRHQSIGEHYRRFNCTSAIEIGIARGELSSYLLSTLPSIREYHAVDPLLGGYDPNSELSNTTRQYDNSAWFNAILRKMRRFGCRFKLHYGFSIDMKSHFAPRSIDCVFIDGDHSYQAVRDDIINYSSILKPGGYFIFDDYSRYYEGVVRAVDELARRNHLNVSQVNTHGNVYIQKPLKKDFI